MPMNSTVRAIDLRLQRAKSGRYNWESQWRDIRDLIRINTLTPGQTDTPGDRRSEALFDATAPWALEQFAAGLSSFLTSATDRWFSIGLAGVPIGRMNDEQLEWCERVADDIFAEFSDPEVNLNPVLNEAYLDIGSFGTAVVYEDYDWNRRRCNFQSFPLSMCWVEENARGRVNALFRQMSMKKHQIIEMFNRPGDVIPGKISGGDDGKDWTIIHAVYPEGMRWKSCWYCDELKSDDGPIREGRFNSFPYYVPRWTKMSNEAYGRSPAMTCLPDVKMINTMSRTVIKAAQKVVDPPLIVPDDGFILPLKTSPGSLIFKSMGQEDTIQPLITNARIDIGLDMMDQRRESILKAFYVDWIIRQKKRERQTATEVIDDRNEMLRQLGPMLGRMQVELLSPMLQRTYELMDAAGRFPEAPPTMAGRKLEVIYISPAAKAQYGTKGMHVNAFINDLVQYAAVDPSIIDIVNPDELATEVSKYRDVSRVVLRSPEEVAEVKRRRQEQAALQSGAEAAKNLGAAAKNFSQARQVEASIP